MIQEDSTTKTLPLETGTLVVCSYRMPSILQPWIHEVYIGVVVEPGDNVEMWNGYNTERYYCETCGYTKVQYSWGIMHDKTDKLIPISPEQATLSFREKIAVFLGDEALANFDGAMGTKKSKVQQVTV